MIVLEILLFCSYINLLALLPLFGARRLAEHMAGNLDHWWSWLIASPAWMSLAVILATTSLAWQLAGTGEKKEQYRWAIALNTGMMVLCWVVPSAWGATEWMQAAAMEIWAIGSGLFLLLSSFHVPISALRRALK